MSLFLRTKGREAARVQPIDVDAALRLNIRAVLARRERLRYRANFQRKRYGFVEPSLVADIECETNNLKSFLEIWRTARLYVRGAR
ncbi:MAG: hypothetical protein KGL39_05605 [Patescibacteria group bacterium]|nr:hypothetical protein [Patescibacteria group bacterium]